MQINERIKNIRIDRDITQAEIAKHLQIDIKTYCRYENGHHEIKATILIALARFYNLSLDYITGIVDTPKPLESSKKELTAKQSALLKAYDNKKEMQVAIDCLLGLK